MGIAVLLADDHVAVRKGVAQVLQSQTDIRVVGAVADGRAAVRQAVALSPDVVVMDISMPMLNGIDATKEIRQRCPDTEVLILSVHSSAEHVLRALHAGARGYVLKESAGSEVVAAVRSVFAHQRYLDAKIADALTGGYPLRNDAKPPWLD